MVDMSTTMEVNQWLESDLGSNVFLRFGSFELLAGSVEAIDICLVVVLVVELHNLAGDGWLKRTVIIFKRLLAITLLQMNRDTNMADREEWPCPGQSLCLP